MRDFVFSELYGPFKCEHDNCSNLTYTIRLTDAENDQLPEQTGVLAVHYIFTKHLGIATCDHHTNNCTITS